MLAAPKHLGSARVPVRRWPAAAGASRRKLCSARRRTPHAGTRMLPRPTRTAASQCAFRKWFVRDALGHSERLEVVLRSAPVEGRVLRTNFLLGNIRPGQLDLGVRRAGVLLSREGLQMPIVVCCIASR